MVYSNHCHRFACSVMLELGSRAPIVIKWPAVVLVIWPHFNGNAQRRPRSASLGLALFSSRICWFLCTSNVHPRGKSNPPRGCQKISVQIPCFLVSSHWRFFGLFACLTLPRNGGGHGTVVSPVCGGTILPLCHRACWVWASPQASKTLEALRGGVQWPKSGPLTC